MRKKILIIGSMRHGKDTVAEMLRDYYGYSFENSSTAASKIFLFDVLKEMYNYASPKECFDDRVNHRQQWHDLIVDYNTPDKSKLAKEIMKNNDIYVGMRSDAECEACLHQKVFDLIIGVFDPRKPIENKTSFNIDLWQKSELIISNAGTLQELRHKVKNLKDIFIT